LEEKKNKKKNEENEEKTKFIFFDLDKNRETLVIELRALL